MKTSLFPDRVKIYWFIFFLFPLFLPGCSEPMASKEIEPHVVLTVKNCVDNSRYTFEATGVSGHVADDNFYFTDSSFSKQSFICYGTELTDTLIIPLNEKQIEITHRVRAFERWSFLLQQGDTAIIEYEHGEPLVNVLNNSKSEYLDLSYERLKRAFLRKDDSLRFTGVSLTHLTPLGVVPNFFNQQPISEFGKKMDEFAKRSYDKAGKQLQLEKYFLDSLWTISKLSEEAYIFYKQKNKLELDLLGLRKRVFLHKEKLGQADLEKYIPSSNDSLLQYDSWQQILYTLEEGYFGKIVNTLNRPNLRIPDYRAMFDTIQSNEKISENVKTLLLNRNIRKIIEHFSAADIESYFKKYEAFVQEDSSRMEVIINKFKNEFIQNNIVYIINKYGLSYQTQYDLALVNIEDDTLSFTQIMQKYKGKVLYIDFWASWCGPCIGLMPYTHKLREEYKGKDLAVVYISIDRKLAAWKRAANKHGLAAYDDSYAVNFEIVSDMLSSLNIKGIPRYLIYDQTGSLLYHNAPGPYGDEIRNVLNQLLDG